MQNWPKEVVVNGELFVLRLNIVSHLERWQIRVEIKQERQPIRRQENKQNSFMRVQNGVVNGNAASRLGTKQATICHCVSHPRVLKSSWCAAGLQRSPQSGEMQ